MKRHADQLGGNQAAAGSGDNDTSVKRPTTFGSGFGISGGLPGSVCAGVFDAFSGVASGIGQSMADLDGLRFGKGKGKGKGRDEPLVGLDGINLEPRIVTTPMDFSRLDTSKDLVSHSMKIPKEIVHHLMTPDHKQMIMESSGAEVEWKPESHLALVRGSIEQLKVASKLLERVKTHCRWGSSEDKVRRLLRPRIIETGLCRLSPMDQLDPAHKKLRPADKMLSAARPRLSIGKDKDNDVVINDALISRQHCFVELDAKRGSLYVTDCSTNGTFLNGVRLPSRKVGKVLLSHGDELLLKDPAKGDKEFGYIVNISEITVKPDVKLEAPRRMLTAEDIKRPDAPA